MRAPRSVLLWKSSRRLRTGRLALRHYSYCSQRSVDAMDLVRAVRDCCVVNRARQRAKFAGCAGRRRARGLLADASDGLPESPMAQRDVPRRCRPSRARRRLRRRCRPARALAGAAGSAASQSPATLGPRRNATLVPRRGGRGCALSSSFGGDGGSSAEPEQPMRGSVGTVGLDPLECEPGGPSAAVAAAAAAALRRQFVVFTTLRSVGSSVILSQNSTRPGLASHSLSQPAISHSSSITQHLRVGLSSEAEHLPVGHKEKRCDSARRLNRCCAAWLLPGKFGSRPK
ncbi:hypothetical protein L1887_51954 [Cichorium endivia]|nr:hypothetical protein L1887_51954 [Cichorium endivia]